MLWLRRYGQAGSCGNRLSSRRDLRSWLNNHEARREVCRDCSKTNFKLDGLCWSTVFCTLYQRMGHPEINCFKACQLCTTPHHKADPCPTRQQAAELKEFLQGLDIPDMPSLDCLNFVKEAIKNEDRTKDRRDLTPPTTLAS
ncbi:hypothetical protein Ae201684P_021064 [Aphanomyces euteiches]|nr:hypothetical protein Ae201684P_021064 [Aphanomyces euteiches]